VFAFFTQFKTDQEPNSHLEANFANASAEEIHANLNESNCTGLSGLVPGENTWKKAANGDAF
jgi:hypothetical protein